MGRAAEILDSVKAVLDEREGNYDSPTPNFQRIASYWTILLEGKLKPGETITPGDVANLMILMKVAREQYKHHPDNYMDIVGYGVCGLRVAEDTSSSGKTI